MNGNVSWTSKNLPIKVLLWEEFKTREEAVEREQYLKTGRGREWIKKEYDKGTLNRMVRQAGAWIDLDKTKIGYEISFNKYFYQHKPLRRIEEVSAEILALEQENEGLIMDILKR